MHRTAMHTVTFAGCSSGTYRLTWAQRALFYWFDTGASDVSNINVRKFGPLDDVPDVPAVLRAIGRVVERHDGLRTRFQGRDRDRRQYVAAAGELEVAEYETSADTLERDLDDLMETLVVPPFGAAELPIRIAVLTIGGVPAHLAFSMFHPCADAIGGAVAFEEIRTLSANPEAPLPAVWQPRDIVAYESSVKGQEHAVRADRHLRVQLDRAVFAPPPARPRDADDDLVFIWSRLTSRAVAAAALALGHRHRVGPASVILAGYAVAFGRWLGQPAFTFGMTCANREDPRMRRTVGNLFQSLPVPVDLTTGSFADLCRELDAAALRAYRYGRYDPVRARRTVAEVEHERGERVLLPYTVNLRVIGQTDFQGDLAAAERAAFMSHADITPSALRDLTGQTRREEKHNPVHGPINDVNFSVWALTDVAQMTVMGDTAMIAREAPLRLLTGLEATLVEATADDALPVAELVERAGLTARPSASPLDPAGAR